MLVAKLAKQRVALVQDVLLALLLACGACARATWHWCGLGGGRARRALNGCEGLLLHHTQHLH